jgi:hypothetical protein
MEIYIMMLNRSKRVTVWIFHSISEIILQNYKPYRGYTWDTDVLYQGENKEPTAKAITMNIIESNAVG